MARNTSAGSTQGPSDEGALASNEFPIVIAGKSDTTATATKRVPVINPDGSLNASLVSGAGLLPIAWAWTDRSGTITNGGAQQQVMGANTSRKALFIQNVSTGVLWISLGGTAVLAQPSTKLEVSASFQEEFTGITQSSISIIGATTGQAFVAREAQ